MKNGILKSTLSTLFFLVSVLSFAQNQSVNYSDGDVALTGFFAQATNISGKAPGVVIIHQWMGLTQHEKNVAIKLASQGYHAFAADIYGVGHTPKNTAEAGKEAGKYKNDYAMFQSRIQAAIKELIKLGADPEKIVVIGYCFGGTGAIEAARAGLNVKGVVSFHGGLKKDESRKNEAISTQVLVLHGADDPFVSKAEIEAFQQEMRDGKADWQMIYYANAVHAFTQIEAGNDNSKGAAYNQKAEERSWEHFMVFLKEVLK